MHYARLGVGLLVSAVARRSARSGATWRHGYASILAGVAGKSLPKASHNVYYVKLNAMLEARMIQS